MAHLFRIGEFSRLCQLPVSALRYYDDIRLLPAAHIDSFTGYRYYALEQLPRLLRILALRDLEMPIDAIRQMLDDDLTPEQIRGMLRLRRAELAEHVQETQERLARVEARLRQLEEDKDMPNYEVIVKPVKAQHVLALREVVPTTEHIGKVWGETWAAFQRAGAHESAPCFAVYYDEGWTGQNIDIEVAYPVAGNSPAEVALGGGRKLTLHEAPAVAHAASTIHRGDYSGLSGCYDALIRWINANGYHITGPSREIYLRGGDGPDAVTEVLFPVEKVS